MKFKSILGTTVIAIFFVGAFGVYRGSVNLTGKCEALGRKLAVSEKRTKLIKFLQNDNALNGKRGNSILEWIVHRNSGDYPNTDEFEVSVQNHPLIKASDFWVYPQIPEYGQHPSGDLAPGPDGFWVPVPFWYRPTGFATDLVFLDLNMNVRFNDGRLISKRHDYRAWIDACGNYVELPKEYEAQ